MRAAATCGRSCRPTAATSARGPASRLCCRCARACLVIDAPHWCRRARTHAVARPPARLPSPGRLRWALARARAPCAASGVCCRRAPAVASPPSHPRRRRGRALSACCPLLPAPCRPAPLAAAPSPSQPFLLALHYLHSRGIAHRDIKPGAGVAWDTRNRLKLGLAGCVLRLVPMLPVASPQLLTGRPCPAPLHPRHTACPPPQRTCCSATLTPSRSSWRTSASRSTCVKSAPSRASARWVRPAHAPRAALAARARAPCLCARAARNAHGPASNAAARLTARRTHERISLTWRPQTIWRQKVRLADWRHHQRTQVLASDTRTAAASRLPSGAHATSPHRARRALRPETRPYLQLRPAPPQSSSAR